MTCEDRSSRRRLGIYLALLVLAVLVLTACASDSDDELEVPGTPGTGLDYALRLDGGKNDEDSSAHFRAAWARNLEAALEPSECPEVNPIEYPNGYYAGPLIDTHLHMPQLSDNFGGEDDSPDSGGVEGGRESEKYDAISEYEIPLLGVTTTLDEIACTLKQEGSTTAFTFFPVFENAPAALIDLAYNAVDRHGSLFVPFIQSSASESATVEAAVLEQMLSLRPDLFVGLGEIGESPTEPLNYPPDDPIYVGDFEVARAHEMVVYFHTGEGDHEAMDRALKMFPDLTFVVHADFVRPHIGDLMADNPNIYFTFNDIFEAIIPKFRFGDKQDFIDAMEQEWEQLIDQGLDHYEDLINTYPDRFMWGTDRADIVWNYDVDIGQLLVRFGRDFIGRLDPAVQDKVGHLNAEGLLR
ncbi:MAG: amidohydrolase family protein [Chloroflexi bacterium]|nr:amidohydrolase family protein [Chloroflexota bacterium]